MMLYQTHHLINQEPNYLHKKNILKLNKRETEVMNLVKRIYKINKRLD